MMMVRPQEPDDKKNGSQTHATGIGPKDPANHPRLLISNPLVEAVKAGADPQSVIPDDAIIVRGGKAYQPRPGNIVSAQMGTDAKSAASGLPHGSVRITTAGEIRAAGGTVKLAPEPAWRGGPLNTWHVNVTEGLQPAFPQEEGANPVPTEERLRRPK
jgi:hypothetical protein